MRKIPVGETISRSYGFAFSNILSIFGIAWVPYAILAAIAVGLVLLIAPDLPRMLLQGDFDPMQFMRASRIFGLLGLLSFLVTCMVTVGIQRRALGRHRAPEYVFLSLATPVWRMVGALFLAWLVIAFIALATGAVVVGIWFVAGNLAPGFAWTVRAIAIVAAFLWIVYLIVRLTFLLPAVVVAEKRIGLARAWELSAGNFWRIFAVAIAVFVPAWIAFRIVYGALAGSFFPMADIHANMDFHEILRVVFQQMQVVGPFVIIAQFVERIVFLGLGNGMIASAYLDLTGNPGAAAPAVQQGV